VQAAEPGTPGGRSGQDWPDWPGGFGGSLADDVGRSLLARRVVLVHGRIEAEAAARAAAALMMLDASGDERIVVRLLSADATVDDGLALMDTMAVLGVPVDTVGLGTTAGGAVGVLAAGRRRQLARHARLRLHEPDGAVAGRAVEVERAVAAHEAQRERFLRALAARTGRPLAHLVEEWATDRYLEPRDAVTLGYADEVEAGPREDRGGSATEPAV
jgi:ATP-dependent Clp endopeptidase proteolytic subunit ClpP